MVEEIDADDMMRDALGNGTVRCQVYGDTFRPLYACYRHSRGEFLIEQGRAVFGECLNCTKWMSAAGVRPPPGGESRARVAPRRVTRPGARRVTCQCGSVIVVDAPLVDCLKCGKMVVVEDYGD